MLNNGEEITLKQCLWLFMNKGFKKCEVWEKSDYITEQINKNGFLLGKKDAIVRQATALEDLGYDKVRIRRNLLLGNFNIIHKEYKKITKQPLIKGTVESLSNEFSYWSKQVVDVKIYGIYHKSLIILLKD